MTLRFEFSTLRSQDGFDTHNKWRTLLAFEADFSVLVGGKTYYAEKLFPVLEFAAQLTEWTAGSDGDFTYNSLETEDNPLISLEERDDGRYGIVARDRNFECDADWSKAEIRECSRAFSEMLVAAILREFGVDVRPIVWPEGS